MNFPLTPLFMMEMPAPSGPLGGEWKEVGGEKNIPESGEVEASSRRNVARFLCVKRETSGEGGGERMNRPLKVKLVINGMGEVVVTAWPLTASTVWPTNLKTLDDNQCSLPEVILEVVRAKTGLDADAGNSFTDKVTDNVLVIELPGSSLNRLVVFAHEFIKENLHHHFSMKEVAKGAGVSAQHFCRVFSEQTGEPFMDCVGRYRAHRAAELLLSTYDSVKEIAFATGHGSLAQFNRQFLRVMGISPSDYRKTGAGFGSDKAQCPACGMVPEHGRSLRIVRK